MKLGSTGLVGMIDKKKIRDKNIGLDVFGIADKRIDEINKFLDSLFEKVNSTGGLHKLEAVHQIIEFADTTVEAVVMFGYFTERYCELQNPLNGLINAITGSDKKTVRREK